MSASVVSRAAAISRSSRAKSKRTPGYPGVFAFTPAVTAPRGVISGATFAIWRVSKNRQQRTVTLSAAISALLGITEPALFGVLTRYKKAFVAATVASSLASAFIAFFGVRLYGYILSSIFSLPAYIGPYFIFALSGVAIAIVLSFTLTTLLVRQER